MAKTNLEFSETFVVAGFTGKSTQSTKSQTFQYEQNCAGCEMQLSGSVAFSQLLDLSIYHFLYL